MAVVSVRKGEYFEAGTPLFQVDTEDLQRIIDRKELEIEKQKSIQKEHLLDEQKTDREQRTAEMRSREDYENVVREADAQIEKCRQALDAARQELEMYDQYISLLSQDGNTVSSGNAEAVAEDSGNSSGPDIDGSTPEQQYNRQEKRHQLVQNVITCSQALEDAERSKEIALQAASRVLEDAGRDSTGSSAAAVEGMDIAYQEKELLRLKELMDRDGWIYSESAGRVTDCRVVVGERTQDGAGILYASDDGEKIIEAIFAEGSGSRLTLYAELSLKASLPGGMRINDKVLLDYMEILDNGDTLAEMPAGGLDLDIGQNVELSYRVQTDNYMTCIPASCIHTDEQGGDYIYIAEEREGILGTEWRVRKVSVTIPDRTDSVVAVESAEITTETRVVVYSTKELSDGDAVRLVSTVF